MKHKRKDYGRGWWTPKRVARWTPAYNRHLADWLQDAQFADDVAGTLDTLRTESFKLITAAQKHQRKNARKSLRMAAQPVQVLETIRQNFRKRHGGQPLEYVAGQRFLAEVKHKDGSTSFRSFGAFEYLERWLLAYRADELDDNAPESVKISDVRRAPPKAKAVQRWQTARDKARRQKKKLPGAPRGKYFESKQLWQGKI
jgi:hypothetical protein